MDEKFAKWKGIDRTEIDWHPKISNDKCTGCGMCVTSCGRKVFDFVNDKAVVARPIQCMVGCTSCEVWCPYNAISFPDKNYVKQLIRDNKLIEKSKKQLQEMKTK